MFDFGLSYTHMLVLGLIAFMVIGKEDMPANSGNSWLRHALCRVNFRAMSIWR
jgi:hypothetical protein